MAPKIRSEKETVGPTDLIKILGGLKIPRSSSSSSQLLKMSLSSFGRAQYPALKLSCQGMVSRDGKLEDVIESRGFLLQALFKRLNL